MEGHMMRMFGSRQEEGMRRGPWTLGEDNLLSHYISKHGEGRWNVLAKCAGLKRTGKSCRLRWLNYLKPDIKRGNLTPQEQLLIHELHSKLGNRWSKIAQQLPGRTDNGIKNYWRTRVQRQARQLNMESSSNRFLETIRCFWAPRLLEQSPPISDTTMNYSLNSVPAQPYSDQYMTLPCHQQQQQSMHNFKECSSSNQSHGFQPFDKTMYNETQILSDSYHVDDDLKTLNQVAPMGFMGSDDMSASGCQVAEPEWVVDGLWDMEDPMWQLGI